MPGYVSREQVDRAKQVNILHYLLTYEPNNVKRVGNAYYLKDHDSLEISNGLWNWHSRGIGGKNVIDYLIKVRGFGFINAVQHLTGDAVTYDYITMKSEPSLERKPFALPPKNFDNEKVIAYLQSRGIDKQIIQDCINRNSLYESVKWHNCVFVGRDDSGKARFASFRATKGDFKRDIGGSEKRFGFVLPPTSGESNTVAVYESPTDALSHQMLYPGFNGWRLSLGCTALAALTNFLERHSEVKHCVVCTDNDEAGNIAAAKIEELPHITVTRSLPPAGLDWNDTLIAVKNHKKPSLIEQLEAAKAIANEINKPNGLEQLGGGIHCMNR